MSLSSLQEITFDSTSKASLWTGRANSEEDYGKLKAAGVTHVIVVCHNDLRSKSVELCATLGLVRFSVDIPLNGRASLSSLNVVAMTLSQLVSEEKKVAVVAGMILQRCVLTLAAFARCHYSYDTQKAKDWALQAFPAGKIRGSDLALLEALHFQPMDRAWSPPASLASCWRAYDEGAKGADKALVSELQMEFESLDQGLAIVPPIESLLRGNRVRVGERWIHAVPEPRGVS